MVIPKPNLISKEESWSIRQKDKGWGYAVAHIVPFVWIYYAASRRTITPALFVFFGAFIIGLFTPEEKATPFAFIATPFLAKAGIVKAKNYGDLKIKALKIEVLENKNNKKFN